ncbi:MULTISPECIES: type II toxin-antitoxin system Phd/YefM family antitoxin [Nocardia]|uniref:type II toxin-antitoxin system Phd/YefM family antitoxin n=1 Tax=Nocardia TaxID=1817 RepID=UPI0018940DF3|nr:MULTISPECIES: type II toxin-antitoxin system prevent-host-death family antitoxin [Nocardia]MBF6350327.1 type II toxin-antitoxin system prevent-host-death family antitoxin [Nocardia flavorosea]
MAGEGGQMVSIPTSNFVGITEVSRDTSRYVSAAADGESFLVMKNNRPVAAIVSPELIDRIQDLDEREQDMRLLIIALSRIMTDNGNRHDLDDVATELGISLTDD